MNWSKIAYYLWLTPKYTEEVSEVLCETAKVVSKIQTSGYLTYTRDRIPVYIQGTNRIVIDGPNNHFGLNITKSLGRLAKGDEVKLSYKEVIIKTYDYVPPNFEEKVFIKEKKGENVFVSAERIIVKKEEENEN